MTDETNERLDRIEAQLIEINSKFELTDETNEQLDRIEAQLIEMNSKFDWRVFWGVLGAHIAFIILAIILVILGMVIAADFFEDTIIRIQS